MTKSGQERRTNLVQGKALLEMLENAIKKYNNGLMTTAEIIQFLVDEVAKKIREHDEREKKLNLSKEELAFYDALAENKSSSGRFRRRKASNYCSRSC